MRTFLSIFISLLVVGAVSSCGIDNYDAPTANFTGKVVYNGSSLGVKGTNETVQLQLWQEGYTSPSAIPVYVAQDGSFSAKLFNGTYKLVARDGNGPWENKHDSVLVVINGSTTVDFPVTPYFTISNENYGVVGDSLIATFTVTSIGTANINQVFLDINKTQFVDKTTNIREVSATGFVGSVRLAAFIGDLSNEKALFARVGLSINNVNDELYSTIASKVK